MDTHADGSPLSSGVSAGSPAPDALLPALSEEQQATLRELGTQWGGDGDSWRRALPVDPNLGEYPDQSEIRTTRFGRFVPVAGREGRLPAIQTTWESEEMPSRMGRVSHRVRRLLLGPPLNASAIAVERMRKLVALPVLSADAISSVAYGPEAMLVILVLAGSAGLSYSLPIAAAIAFLMLSAGISYRQTIRAYPQGSPPPTSDAPRD